MILDETTYWKLRYRLLRQDAERGTFEALLAEQRATMFREAGLEPEKLYSLNDQALTATEITPEAAKIAAQANTVPART